ncbi:MAG: hypothetical protein EAZ97_08815 [Bacteroidetes bacterium]|nr:MAG: hypothetical protein EAZ97_08815 [Bacteroidota bacterium]
MKKTLFKSLFIVLFFSTSLAFCQDYVAPTLYSCISGEACSLVHKKKNTTYSFSYNDQNILTINGASASGTALLYSGKIIIENTITKVGRKMKGEYLVKVPISVNKGYTWDSRTATDFFTVRYIAKTDEIKFKAHGKMLDTMRDTDNGYTTQQILDDLCGDRFTPEYINKIAAAYFILQYNKALKEI